MHRMSRALAHLSWWLSYHLAEPPARKGACRAVAERADEHPYQAGGRGAAPGA